MSDVSVESTYPVALSSNTKSVAERNPEKLPNSIPTVRPIPPSPHVSVLSTVYVPASE